MSLDDASERHAWIGPTVFTVVLIGIVFYFVWFLLSTH